MSDENEMFDIMNILETLLKQSSSAVIIACTKVFLDLTKDNADLQSQVLGRLKAPLLTLMATGVPELGYTVLVHIRLLLSRDSVVQLLSPDSKQFFCRFNEPSYVKTVKLEILRSCLSGNNDATACSPTKA